LLKKVKESDELRSEYEPGDQGKGVRGKFYSAFEKSHNFVLLDPEVAKAFPSEEAVNEALRGLIEKGTDSL
jgi:hypothetical protein